MPRFTDEQVKAATDAFWWEMAGTVRSADVERYAIRVALTAAADAAPAVDTTEFEAALHVLIRWTSTRDHWAHSAVNEAVESLVAGQDVAIRYDGTVKYWSEMVEEQSQVLLDMFRDAAR